MLDWNSILDSGIFWGGIGLLVIVVGTFFPGFLSSKPKDKKKK